MEEVENGLKELRKRGLMGFINNGIKEEGMVKRIVRIKRIDVGDAFLWLNN